MGFRGEFKVGSLDDCIDGTGLLALFIFRQRSIDGVANWEQDWFPEIKIQNSGNRHNGSTYKSTVDAFGHIDVVTSGPPGAILPLLGVDRDGLRGARRLAQLARDAPLLTAGVAPQRVLPPKAGRKESLLIGIVDGHFGLHGNFCREPERAPDFGHEEDSGGAFENVFPRRLGGGVACVDGEGTRG